MVRLDATSDDINVDAIIDINDLTLQYKYKAYCYGVTLTDSGIKFLLEPYNESKDGPLI